MLSQDILFVSLGKFQTFRRAKVKSRNGGEVRMVRGLQAPRTNSERHFFGNKRVACH